MLTVEGFFDMALNSEWRDQALDGCQFPKDITYDDLVFFENIQNLMDIA